MTRFRPKKRGSFFIHQKKSTQCQNSEKVYSKKVYHDQNLQKGTQKSLRGRHGLWQPRKNLDFKCTGDIILCIIVIFFENKYGEGSYIYIVSLLSIVMILGIWIFPEVVTKNKTNGKN